MFGLVVSDNPAFVTVEYNLIQGRFQHGILVTTGTRPRACASGTTPCSRRGARPRAATRRRSSSSARRSSTRATTSSPTRTPTCSARRSCSTTRASSARSPPTRTGTRARIRTRCAWPGTARASRSRNWRALSGQDAASVNSAPPAFSADGRVDVGQPRRGEGLGARPRPRPRGDAAYPPSGARHERVPGHDVDAGRIRSSGSVPPVRTRRPASRRSWRCFSPLPA